MKSLKSINPRSGFKAPSGLRPAAEPVGVVVLARRIVLDMQSLARRAAWPLARSRACGWDYETTSAGEVV